MKLYFKPGACSLSARILLIELGLAFEAIKVDTDKALTETGADYHAINPKGYVPALELSGGEVLTENPAILQYLADQHPDGGFSFPPGSMMRARLQEWLGFTSSELHKAFGPYFQGRALEGVEKDQADLRLGRRIGDVERGLIDGRSFILGEHFSVADTYLFAVLNWSDFVGFSLDRWPLVAAYMGRVAARPATRDALRQEGLLSDGAAA